MKNRTVVLSTLLIAAVAAIVAWLLVLRPAPHVSGPLRHEVYVWQRAWTQPVREAVGQHTKDFQQLVLLSAEITWKDREPQVVPFRFTTRRCERLARPSDSRCALGRMPDRSRRMTTSQTS